MTTTKVINDAHYLVREFDDVEEFLRFIKSVGYDFCETQTKTGFTYWLFNGNACFLVKTDKQILAFDYEPKQSTIKTFNPFKVRCYAMTMEDIVELISSHNEA